MTFDYYKKYEPIFGSWYITKLIGEGSFGKVFEIEREEFGVTYKSALKTITIPQNESEVQNAMFDGMDDNSVAEYFENSIREIISEIELMSKLRGNSNIVCYEDHQVIPHEGKIGWDILIRMELLTPLMVHAKETVLTRRDVIKLGIDMCNALELCQKRNIIHRDIKPENVFVSGDGHFKLGDFGIARTIEKTTDGMSKKGTYTYMAPEMYKGEIYGSSVDIYSLGMLLYRLINKNRAPFMPPYPEKITHSDRENAMIRRMSGEKFPIPSESDGRLAEIVLKACAYDQAERYSAPIQMREELEAIQYSQGESAVIYPLGDTVPVLSVDYADSEDDPTEYVPLKSREKNKSKRMPFIIGSIVAAAVLISIVILIITMGGRETYIEPDAVLSAPEQSKTDQSETTGTVSEDSTFSGDEDNIITADEDNLITADELQTGDKVSIVETKWHSSFAVLEDESLWAWGGNWYGQLGDGSTINRNSPVKIMDDVIAVSSGGSCTMAIKNDGSLWRWGRDLSGFGDSGNFDIQLLPVKIMDDVIAVTTEGDTFVIKSDNSLWGLDLNIWGPNGPVNNDIQHGPVKMMDDVVMVSTSTGVTMAILNDGSLWGWDATWFGPSGEGPDINHLIPVRIMDNVVSVTVGDPSDYTYGDNSIFAIKTDGSLWAWGSNSWGQLGDGSTIDRDSPVKIMDDVTAVSAGSNNRTYAITSDNSLWVWGDSYSGMFWEDDTYGNRRSPVKIMDDIASIATGNGYTMVIKTNGSLWGWGYSSEGQLGDGTTDTHYDPVQIIIDK